MSQSSYSDKEESKNNSTWNVHDDDDSMNHNNNDAANSNSRHGGNPTDLPPDSDTLRIMVSTDNHLGYCESDPVRGLDSFAAFEEVLWLAQKKCCDMVLMAGDLFHENKPSRTTLHKTMDIIRRYTMGPNPVQIQILSNQQQNFTRSLHGQVNYQDEYYSVDLPIFSIHGNHDDPTRDGVGTGNNMLAALDLLSISNLVNYFGRQDQVDKVEISPVLLQKGSTKVALYGMGSMRDERLNRMWTGKKVRFLRPETTDPSSSSSEEEGDDDDEEGGNNKKKENEWFNIFALHQNRDMGRGVKNCVHESMIPEWMDLIVWGHEHECNIEPTESVVGTFRITQPGSSVATSLTSGEAVKKQVGILEIRHNQFRLEAIPLTQVRSFVMGELSLNRYTPEANPSEGDPVLDPEDPNIDTKVSQLLEEEVRILIHEAREKTKELHMDAQRCGNTILFNGNDDHDADESYENGDGDCGNSKSRIKFKIEKPKEVLVRLKVEHTGFTTLNNQRFGAKFVGNVANPTDILLFHRRRMTDSMAGGTKKKKKKRTTGANGALDEPMAPEELEEMNVEDLVKGVLEMAESKLELINEDRLGLALEDYVSKEQKQAIKENFSNDLKKQQKTLFKRASEMEANAHDDDNGGGGDDATATNTSNMKETLAAETEKARKRKTKSNPEPAEDLENARENSRMDDEDDYDDDDDPEVVPAPKSRKRATATSRSSKTTSRASASTTNGRRKTAAAASDDDAVDNDYDLEGTKTTSQRRSAPSRASPRRRTARSKPNYTEDSDDDDDKNTSHNGGGDDGDAIVEIDDSDDEINIVERPKKRGKAAASKSTSKTTGRKKKASSSTTTPFSQAASQALATPSSQRRQTQSQLSFFTVSKSTTKSRKPTTNGRARNSRRAANYDASSDEDENNGRNNDNVDDLMSAGWGSAATPSLGSQKRSTRRRG